MSKIAYHYHFGIDLYSGVRQKPLISKNVLDTVYNLIRICFAKDRVLLFFYLSYTKKCSSNIYERLFINNQFLLARFDAIFFFYMIKLRIPCGRDAPSVVSFM